MYCSTSGAEADPGPAAGAPATERLYYTDAYLRVFTARVVGAAPASGGRPGGVLLDRTAFYPTSGGQPHDLGTLGDRCVTDVVDADGAVVHVLGAPAGEAPAGPPSGAPDRAWAPGAAVEGRLDWPRRFDYMQQHTAQHLLSAVFLRVLGVETVAVHLGDSSTLDLDAAAPSADDVRRVEDAANGIVFENRPVTVRFVEAAEADALGLRRPPRRTGTLRVVEIADCDRSACGGTHVRGTAEIGPVLIRRWERTRGRTRVEFLAGARAVRDYQWKHEFVREWSARLTVRDRDLGEALERTAAEARAAEQALRDARKRLRAYEAAECLAGAPAGAGARKVVRLQFAQRDADGLRALLREITEVEPSVVLSGVIETGRLYFARSAGEGPDLAAVLGRAVLACGGRGGGTPVFAQGTVPPGEAVARALDLAADEVRGA